jgi:hypothetical protein
MTDYYDFLTDHRRVQARLAPTVVRRSPSNVGHGLLRPRSDHRVTGRLPERLRESLRHGLS